MNFFRQKFIYFLQVLLKSVFEDELVVCVTSIARVVVGKPLCGLFHATLCDVQMTSSHICRQI